ncbi:Pfs, NACHT and ankyrin domain protein [Stachybotrys elegans]|uniref:Pfs, NACHT and ankyrin domain protein n=1 Tax=Stachybotrys elegans TaxID=80388 RepID=A0A8K0SWE3_9HYPO|nr:Pfs, NACHT and ankyrin domain protein [Stachybotrys elegans]
MLNVAIREHPWVQVVTTNSWLTVLASLTALRTVFYINDLFWYHRAQRRRRGPEQLPPKYPAFIPYIELGIPFGLNIRKAVLRFTTYNGEATVVRIPLLPGFQVYLYQDPLIIRQIWKVSQLLDFRPMATHFFVNACGMKYESAALYLNDKTGTKSSPVPGSESKDMRVHRIIHESDRQGLAGRGLAPTLQAFRTSFDSLISKYETEEWTDVEDFWTFIQATVGAAEMEAIFGPMLLKQFPNFVYDFFEFDRLIPWLLKGMPFTQAERIRFRLLEDIRGWIKSARVMASKEKIEGGYESRSEAWGPEWTRYRHEFFKSFFDEDAIASHDLGVAWGALGNTVPATLMAMLEVLQDKKLEERVRQQVHVISSATPLSEVPFRDLTSDTLMSAVYAETLRMYVTAFVPVVPLHGELKLGQWRIPQSSYGLMNAGIAHKNKDVWNTRRGAHPVDDFWADRFIVDPSDPESGPVRPEAREKLGVGPPADGDKPYFSTEGLEGSWIPFGGESFFFLLLFSLLFSPLPAQSMSRRGGS